MRKQSTYIVTYKDGKGSRTLYFGPFVSASIASDVVQGLPDPLPGGFKKFSLTQPFGYNDLKTVQFLIMSARQAANDRAA